MGCPTSCPHGRVLRTDGRAERTSDFNHYVGRSLMERMSSLQARVRADARKAGANRLPLQERRPSCSVTLPICASKDGETGSWADRRHLRD